MKTTFIALILAAGVSQALAQVSTTEIFLMNMKLGTENEKDKGKAKVKDSEANKEKYIFSAPVNITHHEGYDNQPEFTPDGENILYVSMPDTTQSDIFEYNIKDSTTTQLSKTIESEFSPKYMTDNKRMTVVRVDADKGQRFYEFADNAEDYSNVTMGMDSVGYYVWLNATTVAFAALNGNMELYIYEVPGQQYLVADKNIGRCLLRIPGEENLVYVKKANDLVTLYKYEVSTGEVSTFCEGLKGCEDYTFMPDGKILGSQDGKLFMLNPSGDKIWKVIGDFSKTIGSFYRMSVSPDGSRIAVVGYKGKKP